MDIERLKEDIMNVEYDLEYGEEQNQGRIAVNVNCLRSVINFANEAIARQSVKSEDVQREIDRLNKVLDQTKEAAKELKEQKYTVNMLPVYNQIKSLELQIAALQDYQPWISVKDRLPTEDDADDHGRIQIYWDNGLVDVWNHVMMGEHVNKYYDGNLTKVTHWKPLPKPPKGE